MGIAASQNRYIALTARKSDLELTHNKLTKKEWIFLINQIML